MQPLRYGWFWLGAGFILAGTIIVLSLVPGTSLPKIGLWDKLEHTSAYVALAAWFGGIVTRSHYAWLAIALLVFGGAIELAQGAMGLGRTADIRDVFANAVGIAIGLLIAWLGVGRLMLEVERRLVPAR